MKYNHPTEIPMSRFLFFDWISDRIPCASVNVRGDTYPVTWAADDALYVGTGDPNWAVRDGANYASNPSKGGWAESEEIYEAMSGLAFEKLTGSPECFRVKRKHSEQGLLGIRDGGWKS